MSTLDTGHEVSRGTIYVVLAALLFALAPAIARFAVSDMNVLILVFWINLWMCVLMCCRVIFRRPVGGIGTTKLTQHFLRSIFTYSALVTYLFAVAHIPFANAVILQSMGPLFVPILALIVFRRLSDRFVWLGVVVSFVGVLLIVRPDNVNISLGEISALLAALGGAAAALVIWSLATTEPPDRQMFYFSLFALLLATLPLPWVWQWPTSGQMFQIALIAMFTIVGQFFYAKAFSVAPADKLTSSSPSRLRLAAFCGKEVDSYCAQTNKA